MPRGVLVTRPEPGLSETMRALAERGLAPVACPLLRISHPVRRLPEPGRLHAVLLTSGQAVAPLAEAASADPAWRSRPVFAVGDATAARALAAGFTAVRSAGGDASDLARLLAEALPPPARLLLATAAGQGGALAARLRTAGYRLHRRVVYAASPVAALPGDAAATLRDGAIACCLFFSAETAGNFKRICPVSLLPSLRGVRALALSAAVAERIEPAHWKSVEIAPHPDAASLFSLIRTMS